MAKNNAPEATFRLGLISAAVFLNELPGSGDSPRHMRTIVLQRSYRDDKSAWQTSNSLNASDIPGALHGLARALDHIDQQGD